MDVGDWLSLASVVIGVVTLALAIAIFRIQSKDLEGKVVRLTHLLTMTLRALEHSKLAQLNRNEKGEIVGLVFSVSASGGSGSGGFVKAEVVPRQDPPG